MDDDPYCGGLRGVIWLIVMSLIVLVIALFGFDD